MSAPTTTETREAWLDRAERDLAAMKAWADEIERRFARLQTEVCPASMACALGGQNA